MSEVPTKLDTHLKHQYPLKTLNLFYSFLELFCGIDSKAKDVSSTLHSQKTNILVKKSQLKCGFLPLSSYTLVRCCLFTFRFGLLLNWERVNYLIGLSAKEVLRRRVPLYSRVPLICSVRAETKRTSLSTFRICISRMKNE